MSFDSEAGRTPAEPAAVLLSDHRTQKTVHKRPSISSIQNHKFGTIEGVDIPHGELSSDGAIAEKFAGEKSSIADDENNSDTPLSLYVNAEGNTVTWDWADDPANPYNWTMGRKWAQVACYATCAFTTSVGTSIMSSAHNELMSEFGVSSTVAILPMSFYVLALAIGPVIIGGPLSEVVGRYPVIMAGAPVGLLFSLGAALVPTSSFASLCVLRFLSGFAFSPSLAIASGVLSEVFRPIERGLPVAVFIVTPFLGPGMG